MRHLLGMEDVGESLESLLSEALDLKRRHKEGRAPSPGPLAGKTLGMIFEKSSTRTRVSFEVGAAKLGGRAIFLSQDDLQLGRGESIEDTAKVLARYVDLLMYRCKRHADLAELARHATVPVINGLSETEHPCQVLADWLTIRERKGTLAGLTFAYLGDGNNMCRSYLLGGALAGMHVRVATPRGYGPGEEYVARARAIATRTGASVHVQVGIDGALAGADVVATDTWVSMGDEKEKEQRLHDFRGFTIDAPRMAQAKGDAIFLHCLPAYYGYEVTKDVAHGPQSAIWDEAENRMWAQMAVMAKLAGAR
ncbi:MAG TPA: ornithine carbamoyltransferase [Candidatus Thermoplasmatota archaeon]|nr:ornithine carbamoyltransferase [Candidatus Thermoplasmatota archaeon]